MSRAQEILDMMTNQPRKFIRGPFTLDVSGIKDGKIECDLVYQSKSYKGFISYNDDVGVDWSFDPMLSPVDSDEDIWLELVFELLSEYGLEETK